MTSTGTSDGSKSNWSLKRVGSVDDALIEHLTDVLIDCVEGGASVSFMLPLTRERAVAFWRGVAEAVEAGRRALLIAEDEQGICGTVQLFFDLPENQPHRADLAKLLVHRRVRRQGLGAALVRAAEDVARESSKTLLVLDAVTHGEAARLYERLGWTRVGDVPNFALRPDGEPCSTTYYFKQLLENTTRDPTRSVKDIAITTHIEWKRDDASFSDNRYSRAHRWHFDGGVSVPASSSPHIVPLPLSDAAAVDPEEAFVAALSSCHMLCFLSIAAKKGFVVDRYVDHATGTMRKNSARQIVIDQVTLSPDVQWSGDPQPSTAQVAAMHESAHEQCFIANSVRSNVQIQPSKQA